VRHLLSSLALAAVAALATVVADPAPAAANGVNTHIWITLQAVDLLPDGELRRMLQRPELQRALINGAAFPDGGYVVNDAYGETAHWEPFIQAYIAWIRESYDTPLNYGEAAEQVAFLMGIASHGMADQTFDMTFVEVARREDAEDWSDTLLDSHDTATDVMLVADTGANIVLDPWLPADDLATVFATGVDYPVDPATLRQGQDLLNRIVVVYGRDTGLNNPTRTQRYREQYPWTSEHLLDELEPGSPPTEAANVAALWLSLWDRLHGITDQQNALIGSYPREGSAGHPVDHTRVESQAVMVFGYGVDKPTLEGRVTAVDDTGHSYEVQVLTAWGTEHCNLIMVRPLEDWGADRDITISVDPIVQFNGGFDLTEPAVLHFSTRAGDPGAPFADPTPHVGEPDVGEPPVEMPPDPEVPDDGGCQASSRPGVRTGLAAILPALAGLVAFFIRWRKRSRIPRR
jgi:zinc dependent phospholipase C